MCTSTWASGQVGPLLVSIGSNASGITSKWVDSMNEKGKGCFFIIQNDHRSHFMTAATTLSMYENLYGPAFDMRRELLGLQGRPGFLMSDAFTGNAALHSGIGLLREKFASLYNIRLPQQQPGGWSAHGQDISFQTASHVFCGFTIYCAIYVWKWCHASSTEVYSKRKITFWCQMSADSLFQDQLHSYYKEMNDDSMKQELGFFKNFFSRPKFHTLLCILLRILLREQL